jgi:hypothetical protein
LVILVLSTADMRGISTPFAVDITSSIAELSGGVPSEVMDTCANIVLPLSRSITINNDDIFMLFGFG